MKPSNTLRKNTAQRLATSQRVANTSTFASTATTASGSAAAASTKTTCPSSTMAWNGPTVSSIGTPVYQGNLSAQTKTMLDRCRAVVAKDPDILLNKIGAALAGGDDRVGGQEIDFQSTPRETFGANWVLPSGLRTEWLKARMRMKRSYVPCTRPQTG